MENGYQLIGLLDLLDMEKFQQLQDNFAKALDLAFITVDYRGKPVFEYSGFTEFCYKIRENEDYLSLCHQCDAHGGLQATITGEPYIYRCHAGLVDFAVPLTLEGKYMGSVMGGQVELIGSAPELKPILPQKTEWKDDQELVDAAKMVYKVTYEKLVASVYLLRDMIQSMMEEEYHKATNAELAKKNRELQGERAARIDLEEKVADYRSATLQKHVDNDYIFHILNVIARLAYREGAGETERVICDFASMIRYITENNNNSFVTVGEELEYIGQYLRIQKLRLESRLKYEISVPEELNGVLCPFMLLQSLVENSLEHGVEPSQEGGQLVICGWAEGDQLLLTISDNGTGMTRKQISIALELEERSPDSNKSNKHLANIHRRLKELFGETCGISIRSKEDGFPGTEVQIRLPIKNTVTQ